MRKFIDSPGKGMIVCGTRIELVIVQSMWLTGFDSPTVGTAILTGYDWRAKLAVSGPKTFINTVLGAVEYLRNPNNPGNQVENGEATWRSGSGHRRPSWPASTRCAPAAGR
ncbi:MAG: hypothetical protein ACRDST_06545 [Pseudonocardiaceae bacterium]